MGQVNTRYRLKKVTKTSARAQDGVRFDNVLDVMESPTPSTVSFLAANQHLKGSFDSEKERVQEGGGRWGYKRKHETQ